MLEVKTLEQVYNIIKNSFMPYDFGIETVAITEALGRILARDILANEFIPAFDRSTVDGYAVIAADTFGSSDSLPTQLNLLDEVVMGKASLQEVIQGTACYIPTGGALPRGANAVVMIENTEDLKDGYIYINKAVAPGNNIIFAGDDAKPGEIILNKNKRLRPQDIGVLAALGYKELSVKKRLAVGIISTGDELVDISEQPKNAQVRDINAYTLYSGALALGASPIMYGIIEDSFTSMQEAVQMAATQCEVVLISGGSSVGNKDLTYKVMEAIGEVLVQGIAIKPGKPTIIGKANNSAIIGLPGHPAAAYVMFGLVVSRIMDALTGVERKASATVKAYMSVNYPSNNGREEFVPVRLEKLDGKYTALPIFNKSGLISMLSEADGYVKIARDAEGLSAGEAVEVMEI